MSAPDPNKPRQEPGVPRTPGTTGHEWDGIQELNNPLPRWWLYILYATIAFAALWSVLYPSWPIPGGYTKGTLNHSSRLEVEAKLDALKAERAQKLAGLESIAIEDLPKNPMLMQAAIEGGKSTFKVYCVQCHGSGATGSKGYPNLNDDDWLWGGSLSEIYTSINHGIRQPGHDATRQSLMPAFGKDGLLSKREISAVVEHVRAISNNEHNAALAAKGATIFAQQCASCHGADGKGDKTFGAPNLADSISLYGNDRDSLTHTVFYARAGVMPAWENRLDETTIRQLTAFVHSLGGGA